MLAGLLDAEFGRSLNEVQKLRELSDYLGDPPPKQATITVVRLAGNFVAAVERIDDKPDNAATF